MGFFSSKSSKTEPQPVVNNNTVDTKPQAEISRDNIKTPTVNISVIKDSFKVKAEIEGKGSFVIGGEFDGNLTIDDTLFIENGAKFTGTVHAKNVKIAGEFNGTIYSTATEVTEGGKFSGNINANKTFLGGEIDGIVKSIDSIEITNSGKVNTSECKSKQIKIEGSLKGKVVASELLEVTSGGSVEGEIITKGIRTEQGGTIIGNIQTYDSSIHADNGFERDEPKIEKDPSSLINIKPDDIQKYAKKEEDKGIKRIPADKK